MSSEPAPAHERHRVPRWAAIAAIYLVARLITTGFLLLAANLSTASSRFGADADLGSLLGGWDAAWYAYIAAVGYPTDLPLSADGFVETNQWAFMPVYPYLSAVVGAPFGSWLAGAVVVSLAAGYGACLVLFALLRDRIGDSPAMWAVVFFSVGPLAALFHVGYAESLFLLLLFLALWAVMRRRFAWVYPLIVVMGYTRPGVLAFALFLGLYGIHRWFTRRRDPLPVRDIVHIVALGALATIVGFSWQFIAAAVTGSPSAYLDTELAWRRGWIDTSEHFVPFSGFIEGAALWFRLWGLPEVAAYVVLGLVVAGIAAVLLFVPAVKALGPEIRLWSASYLVYLLAVFFPQSSVFRLLVPLSPLWGAAAVPRSVWWRGGVVAVCLLGQWWWIYNMYALASMYWQIP
nr:hypothetical protein [Microbacterium thalassium]